MDSFRRFKKGEVYEPTPDIGGFFLIEYVQNQRKDRGGATPSIEPTIWVWHIDFISHKLGVRGGFKLTEKNGVTATPLFAAAARDWVRTDFRIDQIDVSTLNPDTKEEL